MQMSSLFRSFLLGSLLPLSACTSVVAVKDVTADQDGYQQQKFSAANVDANLVGKLSTTGTRTFNKLTITRSVTVEGSDGKKETNVQTTNYVNAGNGLVSYKTEHAHNGIPYGLTYGVTYRGLLPLRMQIVPLRQQNTSFIYEVKELTAISAVPNDAGQTVNMKYKSGTTAQLGNYLETEKTCTSTRRFDASELHSKLSGIAIALSCEERSNNTVRSRSKWVLLDQLGFAIQTEDVSSNSTSSYQITDIKS
jgi:hypothetical protein